MVQMKEVSWPLRDAFWMLQVNLNYRRVGTKQDKKKT